MSNSRNKKNKVPGDPTPVVGGGDIPARMLRPTPVLDNPPKDDLGKHIARLLALHPDIVLDFRSSDLNLMDDSTKRDLIGDINKVLGIQPLTSRQL